MYLVSSYTTTYLCYLIYEYKNNVIMAIGINDSIHLH